MFNIQDYLKKFRRLTSHEGEVKDVVQTVIREELGVLVDRDKIQFVNKRVSISTHPMVKSELFLVKKKLLSEIQKRVTCRIEDIR